jgi:hypothetical protein
MLFLVQDDRYFNYLDDRDESKPRTHDKIGGLSINTYQKNLIVSQIMDSARWDLGGESWNKKPGTEITSTFPIFH